MRCVCGTEMKVIQVSGDHALLQCPSCGRQIPQIVMKETKGNPRIVRVTQEEFHYSGKFFGATDVHVNSPYQPKKQGLIERFKRWLGN